MKKLLVVISAGFFCFLISCDSKKESGGMSDAAKKNLDAQHGVINCFDTKDFSKIGDYIAEDCIDHGGEKGEIKGLANMKAEFEKMVVTMDSQKTETIAELANDEYAMSWLHFSGTYKTDQMGMKAGDKYDMKALELSKFKDGKAVEHWTFMEPKDMMDMMKMMPPPPPAKDSIK